MHEERDDAQVEEFRIKEQETIAHKIEASSGINLTHPASHVASSAQKRSITRRYRSISIGHVAAMMTATSCIARHR